MDNVLELPQVRLRLEFEDLGESNQVIVVDTGRNVSGSYAAVTMEGCFTDANDTPVTKSQMSTLDSQEVENWLNEVGY